MKTLLLLILLGWSTCCSMFAQTNADGGWYQIPGGGEGRIMGAFTSSHPPGSSGSGLTTPGGVTPSAIAEAITPDIQTLADALQDDPVQIYAYVHDHIKQVFYFGSKKGAELTLLEESGNDFDQCALLTALLNAAGYANTSYIFGYQTIPYTNSDHYDLQHWLGFPMPNTNWATTWDVVSRVFTNSGTPIWYDIGDANDVGVLRVLVNATIGGTTYCLDPGFKISDTTVGINLSSAMGLNTNTLMSGAGGTGTANYVMSMNEGSIRSNLTSYTTTFLGYLQSNYPNASVSQIVGGQQIEPFGNGLLPTSFHFGTPWGYFDVDQQTWTTIPTNFMATISLHIESTNLFFLFPQLQGQRLSLTFGPGGTARFYIEDSNILQIFTTDPGPTTPIIIKGGFPNYGWNSTNQAPPLIFVSVTNAYQRTNSSYAILYGCNVGQKWLARRQQKLQQYQSVGFTNGSQQIVTETLNIMGLTWLAETDLSTLLVSQEMGIANVFHARMGRVSQERNNGYHIDIGGQYSSVASLLQSGSQGWQMAQNNYDVQAYFSSCFEHGVIEQLQNSGLLGVSAVKVLETASTNSHKIYLADSGNWSGVSGLLSGWDTNMLGNLIANGDTLLLPGDGALTIDGWTGGGYVALKSQTNGAYSVGMIETGHYGGDVSQPSAVVDTSMTLAAAAGTGTYYNLQNVDGFQTRMTADPVDTADGTFQIWTKDFDIGGIEPSGLHVSHYYNSSHRNDKTSSMGNGWINNYCCFLQQGPAEFAQLGATTPQQMAAMIVSTCAANGIYSTVHNPTNWVLTALIAKWGIDQVISNGLSVVLGKDTQQFVLQPDGSITPPANCTATLSGSPGSWQYQERRGRTFSFSGNGPLSKSTAISSIQDHWSNLLSFSWSGGMLTAVTNSLGQNLHFNYTGSNLTSIVDNDSPARTVSFTYVTNVSGQVNLSSFADLDGTTTAYTYDTNSDLTSVVDQKGRLVVTNFYDQFGHVTSQYVEGQTTQQWQMFWSKWQMRVVDPAGDQEIYFFDDKSRQVSYRDAVSNLTQTFYDGQDHLIESISPLGEANLAIYDGNNDLVETIDPMGFSNVFTFDSSFNPIAVADGRGKTSHFGYNSQFALTGSTNGNGDWSVFSYNVNGTLASRQDAGGTTSYSYDSYNHVNGITYPSSLGSESFINNYSGDSTSHTDVRGFTTAFAYDYRRHLTNTVAPTNLTVTAFYDPCGNFSTSTDPRGNLTSNNWSATSKLLSTTFPTTSAGTPVFTSSYDNRDWLMSKQNPLGYTAYFTNDAAHRQIAIRDPLQRATLIHYDGDGHLTNSTDAANDQTAQTWDARGNLVKVVDAASDVIGKTYDGARNLIFLTNRNGKVWTFQYDGANRLTNTVSPLGNVFKSSYNNRGLLQSTTDALNKTTTYGYDARGRATSKTDSVGANTYQYDGNNNLTQLSAATGGTMSWSYDAYNRLNKYTSTAGNVIQYRYDVSGNLTNLIYPGGLTVVYAYDSNNHLTNVADWSGRQTALTYDLAGNLTSIIRPNGTVRLTSYDADSELTNIIEKTSSQFPICFYALGYNSACRVTSEFKGPLLHPATPPTRTMTYDFDNRLATFNGTSIGVDSDGRLTSAPGTNNTFGAYTNDARSELTGAFGLVYGYDPAGNRSTFASGLTSTTFVVDPQGSKVLMRTSGSTTSYYIYGPGLLYEIDVTGGVTSVAYYHYDCRGSTVALTDGSGNVTDLIEYSAYGNITYRVGTNSTPFLFNGRYGVQTDPNGLLYMRARYYNPYICRFINPDPSQFKGGLNFFAFANGNPISLTDPFGLDAQGADSGSSNWQQGAHQYWQGFGNATASWASGLWNAVTHPATIALGLANMVDNPNQVFSGLWNSAVSAFNDLGSANPQTQGQAMANILLGIVSVAAPEGEAGSVAATEESAVAAAPVAAGEGSVPLFRAVDQGELPSVQEGTYGSSPSMGGKYFALTQEGAQNIAGSTMNAGQQMTITSTTVPQSVFDMGYLFNDPGPQGAGPSVHFAQDFLPTLYNSMTPIQIH